MNSRSSWPAVTGTLLALACAGATAQPARLAIPPLPAKVEGLPALDARALQALTPPGSPPGNASSNRPEPVKSVSAPAAAAAPVPPVRKIVTAAKACRIDFSPKATSLAVKEFRGELKIKFTGDKGCLTAVSADQLWADAALKTHSEEVVITYEANPTLEPRRATVFVVAGQEQIEFVLLQREAEPPPPVEPPVVERAPDPSPGSVQATQAPSAEAPAPTTSPSPEPLAHPAAQDVAPRPEPGIAPTPSSTEAPAPDVKPKGLVVATSAENAHEVEPGSKPVPPELSRLAEPDEEDVAVEDQLVEPPAVPDVVSPLPEMLQPAHLNQDPVAGAEPSRPLAEALPAGGPGDGYEEFDLSEEEPRR